MARLDMANRDDDRHRVAATAMRRWVIRAAILSAVALTGAGCVVGGTGYGGDGYGDGGFGGYGNPYGYADGGFGGGYFDRFGGREDYRLRGDRAGPFGRGYGFAPIPLTGRSGGIGRSGGYHN